MKKLLYTLLLLFLVAFVSGCGEETPLSDTAYTLVLDENMSAADPLLWQASDWANGDPFYNGWCTQQLAFAGGVMTLTLEALPCNGKTHASGEYRSQDVYGYGRYSARLKAGDVNGTITSFFTYTGPSEGTEHDEIDVEIFGKDPTKMQLNYWRNGVEHPTLIDLGFDASQAYHLYSFTWSPAAIVWYVDGIAVHTEEGSSGALPLLPGKIMMNLWACTGIEAWCGAYSDGTLTQAQYDYVTFEAAN